jgi:3-oxoacyl-[acyl-carrier-protein] synthase II
MVGRMALSAARLALEHAALDVTADPSSVGMVLGSNTAGGHTTGEYLESLMRGGAAGAPALLFANTVGNTAASVCGLELTLRGPNTTISHKEASGVAAIAYAADLVALGRARALVTGGADDLYENFFRVHDRFGVLSRGNGAVEGSRPFDAARNGFVMAEGAFLCVIEPAESARARGATVHAEIAGVGAGGTSLPINAWPNAPGPLARTMRLAIEDAGCTPDEVGAVYASANSTRQLDRVEADALRLVFGSRPVPVVSIKGALGECGSIGAAAVMAAALCGRTLPPTAGLDRLDSACPVNARNSPQAIETPLVLVNSVGNGGALYSLVLRVTSS